MFRMKKYIPGFAIVIGFGGVHGQNVENMKHEFRGEKLVVTYDLSSSRKASCKVVFKLIKPGGFEYYPYRMTGDVGDKIAPGSQKEIIWEYLKEPGAIEQGVKFLVEVQRDQNSPAKADSSAKAQEINVLNSRQIEKHHQAGIQHAREEEHYGNPWTLEDTALAAIRDQAEQSNVSKAPVLTENEFEIVTSPESRSSPENPAEFSANPDLANLPAETGKTVSESASGLADSEWRTPVESAAQNESGMIEINDKETGEELIKSRQESVVRSQETESDWESLESEKELSENSRGDGLPLPEKELESGEYSELEENEFEEEPVVTPQELPVNENRVETGDENFKEQFREAWSNRKSDEIGGDSTMYAGKIDSLSETERYPYLHALRMQVKAGNSGPEIIVAAAANLPTPLIKEWMKNSEKTRKTINPLESRKDTISENKQDSLAGEMTQVAKTRGGIIMSPGLSRSVYSEISPGSFNRFRICGDAGLFLRQAVAGNAGVQVEISMAIRSGVMLSSSSYQLQDSTDTVNVTSDSYLRRSLTYARLPLLFTLQVSQDFCLLAGAFAAMAISGNELYRMDVVSLSDDSAAVPVLTSSDAINNLFSPEDYPPANGGIFPFRRLDAGLMVGFQMESERWILGFRYERSFLNIRENAYFPSASWESRVWQGNSAMNIQLGIRFGKKRDL